MTREFVTLLFASCFSLSKFVRITFLFSMLYFYWLVFQPMYCGRLSLKLVFYILDKIFSQQICFVSRTLDAHLNNKVDITNEDLEAMLSEGERSACNSTLRQNLLKSQNVFGYSNEIIWKSGITRLFNRNIISMLD